MPTGKIRHKSLPISRSDLGYGFFERVQLDFSQKIIDNLLARFSTPLTKLLHLLIFGNYLHGRVNRLDEVLIPTSDGAKLATDVYLPKKLYKKNGKKNGKENGKENGKGPAILIRTPYWKDSISILGHYLALKGYIAVLQDIRGAGHSNPYGNNTFFFSERNDGIDTAKWIKKQPWSNGKLGMWGSSYFGLTQWAVSWENGNETDNLFQCLNPGLSTPHMIWSAHNGLDIHAIGIDIARIFHETTKFYDGVSPRKVMMEHTHQLTEAMLLDPKLGLYNDPIDQSNYELDLEKDLKGLSYEEKSKKLSEFSDIDFTKRDFDKFKVLMQKFILKRKINLFSKYMAGMLEYDPKKINVPILILSGWYDMFNKPTMDNFTEIQQKSPSEIQDKIKIVVGPWAHGMIGDPEVNLLFAVGGWYDFLKHLIPWDWYDYWLKGIKNNILEQDPLTIFVMGKNEWRYEKNWPLKRAQERILYLHSDGRANSLSGTGVLSFKRPKESEFPDTYVFDPLNPVLTAGGNNLGLPKGAVDQKVAESRKDVLVYTSLPLKNGMEITGNINVVLYAESNAEDTDFMVKLTNVYPNGKSLNILDRGIRARYRALDYENPSLIEPGKIYEYNIPLGPTSIYFNKGNRIRLDITSSDFPKYNINANLGGKGKPFEYTIARQQIHHDIEHPSRIILPYIPIRYF